MQSRGESLNLSPKLNVSKSFEQKSYHHDETDFQIDELIHRGCVRVMQGVQLHHRFWAHYLKKQGLVLLFSAWQ